MTTLTKSINSENINKIENYVFYSDADATKEAFKEVENHLFYYAELLSEYMNMDIHVCRALTKKGFRSNGFIKKLITSEGKLEDFLEFVVETVGRCEILSDNGIEINIDDKFSYYRE